MDSPNYYTALIKVIEDNIKSESDKMIEHKVKEFEENLKRIRDKSIAETISNIRIMCEENTIYGGVNISINYKG